MADIYLAGKLDSAEISISEFATELEARGHTVLEKWWQKGRLPRPYLMHLEKSQPASESMIRAAGDCDVFILFPEDTILGAAVEFGAALQSSRANPDKHVIVLNPDLVNRQTVFYAHPSVIALNGIAGVREMQWY